MVVASSADCIKVNVALCTVGKSLPEVFKAVCLEAAFFSFADGNKRNVCKLGVAYAERSSAKVYGSLKETFVHRIDEASCAVDSGAVAKGLCKKLPQSNACIFDKVVLVNLKVALDFSVQVKHSVLAERVEHVVEEPYRVFYGAFSAAVKIQFEGNLSFLCVAFDFCNACHIFPLL